VRKIILICLGLWLCGWSASADTFQLNDGRTITGEPLFTAANDAGLQIRIAEGQYERVPWASFSQADLKTFQQQPKLAPLVEPFIEISEEERLQKTHVEIKPVPRLERPEAHSLFGAMFSSGVGVVVLLLLYAANLYAAYEISIFRARPVAVVCGVSALLPFIGPIIFLSMHTVMEHAPAEEEEVHAEAAAGAPRPASGAAMPDSSPLAPPEAVSAAHAPPAAASLRIAHAEAAAPGAPAALPQTQTFQRGAFTFNRRFFETKFPGFFGVVRRDAEKDLQIVIKSARGEYHGQRITRITGNDLHLEVHKGHASEEVLIPFTEIKEVQLKHKDAK